MTLVAEAFEGTLKDFDTLCFLVGTDDGRRYRELYDTYAQSEHGRHHQQQPLRYEAAFGCYDRGQMLRDLGADIHPVKHMLATERTFVEVMRHGYDRSYMDVHVGRVTALVHDIGECTHPSLLESCGAVVGDIPQGRKTPEQRATEMRVWDSLMEQYYQEKLPDSQIAQARQVVMHRGGGGRFGLQAAFEAAHDTNTWRVGLRAGKLALASLEQGDTDNHRFSILRNIGLVVTRDAKGRIEEHVARFGLAGRILDNAEPLYHRIHAEL